MKQKIYSYMYDKKIFRYFKKKLVSFKKYISFLNSVKINDGRKSLIKAIFQGRKKYLFSYIRSLDNQNLNCTKKESDNVIWIFWWQGEEKMPDIVSKIIKYNMQFLKTKEVILVTKDNYSKYVNVDDEIVERLKNKEITITMFADYIRLLLLKEYGGIWLDATLLIIGKVPFEDIKKYEFYSGHTCIGKKWHGISKSKWTTYFLASNCKNSEIFSRMSFLFTKYIKKIKINYEYFMMDYMFEYLYRTYPSIKLVIDEIPQNNSYGEISYFEENFNKEFKKRKMEEICNKCYFQKLSYKRKILKGFTKNGKETNYGYIMKLIK